MEPELPDIREAGKRLRKLAVVGAALEVTKLAMKDQDFRTVQACSRAVPAVSHRDSESESRV